MSQQHLFTPSVNLAAALFFVFRLVSKHQLQHEVKNWLQAELKKNKKTHELVQTTCTHNQGRYSATGAGCPHSAACSVVPEEETTSHVTWDVFPINRPAHLQFPSQLWQQSCRWSFQHSQYVLVKGGRRGVEQHRFPPHDNSITLKSCARCGKKKGPRRTSEPAVKL